MQSFIKNLLKGCQIHSAKSLIIKMSVEVRSHAGKITEAKNANHC